MDDLVTWLRAVLDERERLALAAWQGNGWRHENQPTEVWTGKAAPGHTPIPIAKAWDEPTAAFIANYDPARVLREVEATRRIIDRYDDCLSRLESEHFEMAARDQVREYEDFILPALALAHADRPGYREEWRP